MFPKSATERAGDALADDLRATLPHIRECPGVESANVVCTYDLPINVLAHGGRCPLKYVDLEIAFTDAAASLSVDATAIARRLDAAHPRWTLAHYRGRGTNGDPRYFFTARWQSGGNFRPWGGTGDCR